MKISEVLERLETWHQPFTRPDTRDVVKCGDPGQECMGIAVTCCPTAEVIQKAADAGCNLLIAHESMLYGDEFDPAGFIDNAVLEEKQSLLKATGMVVYRDHDHMHGTGGGPRHEPRVNRDWIYYGIMKELGWEKYLIGDELKPLQYRLPETTVRELAGLLMQKLNLNGMRIVGSMDARVETVYLVEHCMGRGDQEKINLCKDFDVMIPLEIVDWTLSHYVRDAVYFGKPKAILEMGHFNFEEPGMKYMAEWMPQAIGTADIPIRFIPAGDSFHYLTAENCSLDS